MASARVSCARRTTSAIDVNGPSRCAVCSASLTFSPSPRMCRQPMRRQRPASTETTESTESITEFAEDSEDAEDDNGFVNLLTTTESVLCDLCGPLWSL